MPGESVPLEIEGVRVGLIAVDDMLPPPSTRRPAATGPDHEQADGESDPGPPDRRSIVRDSSSMGLDSTPADAYHSRLGLVMSVPFGAHPRT